MARRHDAPTMNALTRIALVIVLAAGPYRAASGDALPSSPIAPLPQLLSETGLYVAGSTSQVRPDVHAFVPQYPLWSDGARKRRWISLPPGTAIDASRPDAWEFPRGTRLWKEFALDRRVETRYIERLADGSWRFATYVWNEDGTDAVLAPAAGLPALADADGRDGRYAIPSEIDCRACHEGPAVPVLGFSALQLSPDRDPLAPHAETPGTNPLDLRALVARGWLRNLPRELLDQPPRIAAGSPTERAVLGYLHGNCGHCHVSATEAGAAVPVEVRLAQQASSPISREAMLLSLVGVPSRYRPHGLPVPARLVVPGQPQSSVLAIRMGSRDPRVQMPPLGTAIPDTEALALVERWINQDLTSVREARR